MSAGPTALGAGSRISFQRAMAGTKSDVAVQRPIKDTNSLPYIDIHCKVPSERNSLERPSRKELVRMLRLDNKCRLTGAEAYRKIRGSFPARDR